MTYLNPTPAEQEQTKILTCKACTLADYMKTCKICAFKVRLENKEKESIMPKYISRIRNNINVITFNQTFVKKNFFTIAKELNYKINATGNLELTHEIICSEIDFKELINLSEESKES